MEERYEQGELALHLNTSFNEQEDDHPSDVHEESHPNFPHGECNQHAKNVVSNNFKENFSLPIYDEQEGNVQEEGDIHFPYEECNQHAETLVSNVFKEYFSMPIYNECEDGHLDDTPQEPTICEDRLDHQEYESPRWDVSSCFPNSECQEECISPDFLEEEEDSKWDVSSCSSNSELLCQKEFISLDVI